MKKTRQLFYCYSFAALKICISFFFNSKSIFNKLKKEVKQYINILVVSHSMTLTTQWLLPIKTTTKKHDLS